ncbi:MAG: DUF364 domain-containing protein [Vicinamibacterales bacterium]|jgi:hypothetical protein|nr:DUF364 domain-containing protein [Vicinamibacterales bacterium]
MTILDELLDSVREDAPVRSVLVGAHYTAVCSRRCGLASTLIGCLPHGEDPVRDVGRLHLKRARELAEYARSANLLEASIGMAALNSLLPPDGGRAADLNALAVLAGKGAGKKVALVGHFPFVPELERTVGSLWVLELCPADGDWPAAAAADLIPQADVVGLTSSAFINHTFDGLLALCRPDAFVVALGPTTPLSPVLFEHGVHVLAGSDVTDETLVLQTLGQGASFREVKGVRRIALTAPGTTR